MAKKFQGRPGVSVYRPGSYFKIIVGDDGFVELDDPEDIKLAKRSAVLTEVEEEDEEPKVEDEEPKVVIKKTRSTKK